MESELRGIIYQLGGVEQGAKDIDIDLHEETQGPSIRSVVQGKVSFLKLRIAVFQ